MRLATLAAAGFAAVGLFFATPARAFEDIDVGAAEVYRHWDFGQVNSELPPSPGSVYSNVDNFTGFGITHGGTVVNAGNGGLMTTRLLADDLNSVGSFDVMSVAGWNMKFSVANLNATAVTARFRVRFYLRDGAAGVPGTALGGFSFTATSIPVGVTVFSSTGLPSLGAGIPPAGTTQIWAGIFFDNNASPATTAAQLDNLGQGTFNPPGVGTSADQDFLSGPPTNTFLVNNPTGAIRSSPFAGNPVANYGWEIAAVPEPAALGILGFGLVGLAIRRRRA
jgi:hypothetical protein